MNNSYKREHEEFVSGHEGTSLFEASAVFTVTVAVCLLRDGFSLLDLYPSSSKMIVQGVKSRSSFTRVNQGAEWHITLQLVHVTSYGSPSLGIFFLVTQLWRVIPPSRVFVKGRFAIDFIILAIPNLLNVTVLSSYILWNLAIIFMISSTLFLFFFVKDGISQHFNSLMKNANLGEKKLFVTNLRSMVNLLTAICILAVDFRIFPRRFAKAETYGYGIMDAGVGFFVVSNAIVSPEARNKGCQLPWKQQIKRALLSSLPLIILGAARLLSVKSVDYHEHVTEYGVHWNFFFTLAALKVFCSMIFFILQGSNPLAVGIIIAALHQFFLSQGLSDYIMKGADGKGGRQGVIDANREGIISLPGYFAIYMISVQLGKFIFQKRDSIKEWLLAAFHLTVFLSISLVLMQSLNDFVQPVSRRFSNAAYIFYVVGQSCLTLTVTLTADILRTSVVYVRTNFVETPSCKSDRLKETSEDKTLKQTSLSPHLVRRNLYEAGHVTGIQSSDNTYKTCLLEAIGFNSLLFFLLANLLTGFVNLTLSTIYASHVTSVFILLCYLLVLSLTVTVLHEKGITTKIW